MQGTPTEGNGFPRGLSIFGWIIVAATSLLTLDMLYEQTVLTWRGGWQMLGFSLAHAHPGLLSIGMLGALCAHLFLVLLLVRGLRYKFRLSRLNLPLILTLSLVTGLLYVPYSSWIILLVKALGPGQQGNSYLSFAVSEHHLYLLRTLLDSGVRVDAPYAGHTALNAACLGKDLQVARYLISKGADVSKAPDCEFWTEFTGKPEPVRIPGTSVDVHP